MLVIFGILPFIVHEAAHFLMSLLLGEPLKMKLVITNLGPVPIPRFVWFFPKVSQTKLRLICQAGFVVELALIPFFPFIYQSVALLHFALYPWYAGEHSDFFGY